MDYNKHYDRLMSRAKNRILEGYGETHHIVPRCLGGSDESKNLVSLTASEHYVAHQLLVKIHPENEKLIYAAAMMSRHPNGKRSNNKQYSWLRQRYIAVCKKRKGDKNGSYGRRWYYCPKTLKNIKCLPAEKPEGYVLGRKVQNLKKYYCIVCGDETGSRRRKYCDEHRKEVKQRNHQKLVEQQKKRFENDQDYKSKMLDNLKKGRITGIKRTRRLG